MDILDQLPHSTRNSSKLARLNLIRWWDLALHIPLRYEDLTKVYPIRDAAIGTQVMIEGKIIGHEIIYRRSKQLLVRLDDGTAIISLLFFHFYPSYATQYAIGKQIRAHGEIKADFHGNKTIIHPKIQTVTETNQKLGNTFTPIYPTTNGLSNQTIIDLVNQLFEANLIHETLADEILANYQLPRLEQALLTLHKLTPHQFSINQQAQALRRLKYDELIAQQLLMQKIYLNKHHHPAPPLKTTNQLLVPLLASLPFELTTAQKKVLGEILADMNKPQQMNRLLQGDVGSGKTIVATIAALVAIECGYQAAIMAPTEILAEQHFIKTQKLLQDSGVNLVWLSGSLSSKYKRAAYQQIQDGSAQLIIGTHAIFQKQVEFNNLGIVIIDEQHRFGVDQRLALINKGRPENHPHQLMMSATPIPRSLAMSYYADLDVSSIDELPPGRTPIETILINNNRRQEVVEFIHQQLLNQQQAYWVCPLIEESETLELENALNTFNELQNLLPEITIGLVHGRLKPKEKAEIMQAFSSNQLQLLVATTVIEVGVDVPNATTMVIEHSERMGLAQLHQLRGRVGRGSQKSQCVLLYDYAMSEVAKQRLRVISQSTDGFEIARQDLLIRGPGELLGARQSGLPALRFANLEQDLAILQDAKVIATLLAKKYPTQAQQLVELWFHNKQIYAGA